MQGSDLLRLSDAVTTRCIRCDREFTTRLVLVYRHEMPADRICSVCRELENAEDHDRHVQTRIDQAMIPSEYRACTFQNFERRRGTEDAYRAIADWASSVRDGKKPRGVILEGPPGSGKTHLEVAAVMQVMQVRLSRVLFLNVPEWLNDLRSAYAQLDDPSLLPSAPRDYDVLVLDDLGAEDPGALARNQLYTVINYREARRLPTLASTNLQPGELASRLGGATMSRLERLCKRVSLNSIDRDYRAILTERGAA